MCYRLRHRGQEEAALEIWQKLGTGVLTDAGLDGVAETIDTLAACSSKVCGRVGSQEAAGVALLKTLRARSALFRIPLTIAPLPPVFPYPRSSSCSSTRDGSFYAPP